MQPGHEWNRQYTHARAQTQTNHYIKNGEHHSPQQNDMICKQHWLQNKALMMELNLEGKLVNLRKNMSGTYFTTNNNKFKFLPGMHRYENSGQ